VGYKARKTNVNQCFNCIVADYWPLNESFAQADILAEGKNM
jgi:UDP:flavonoid glycosyltransferase YjiC (YdhE family)